MTQRGAWRDECSQALVTVFSDRVQAPHLHRRQDGPHQERVRKSKPLVSFGRKSMGTRAKGRDWRVLPKLFVKAALVHGDEGKEGGGIRQHTSLEQPFYR